MLMIPLVRGSVVSPNGFTGGITTSASSPEIYDFDVEQITPTVSCEIEVDEPDHIQAKTRKRQKENDKLLEDYKKSILKDKNDRALRKKMDEEEATKKKVKRKPQHEEDQDSIYQAATKKVTEKRLQRKSAKIKKTIDTKTSRTKIYNLSLLSLVEIVSFMDYRGDLTMC